MNQPKPISLYRARLGEGPVYDERNGLLYWLDIEMGRIIVYNENNGKEEYIDLKRRDYISSMCLSETGRLVATLRYGFYWVEADGSATPIAEILERRQDIRFNDGKCDARGRYWAGTMDLNETRAIGALYVLEGSALRPVLHNVTISNGIAWSLDNKTMYYIDSPTKMVKAFRFDLEKGQLGGSWIAVDMRHEEGIPDGMTIDSEGMLWVAVYGGGKVVRYDPSSGEKLEEIKLPVSYTTSVVFGGADMKTLYITTAGREEKEEAGRLFAVELPYKGVPLYRYREKL
ncbi:MAG: SMP-30/gluconolactonase/LRE family protein [Thermoproteus sp. AZ2]|uniref:SMP-30/gluconolactonase/LRE family protein n=1 Tax=Thermoproteus sp. AZ2 TaxID=1609232 RepID=A0ACC6V390_9CREN|nr:MAG: hypothetical protein TU35_07920 [Thermoproteus sp. AZ2]